jgi:hypothetical protein
MVSEENMETLILQAITEIERHKWLESEKQGQDIGGNPAALDFLVKHYETWLKERLGSFKQN